MLGIKDKLMLRVVSVNIRMVWLGFFLLFGKNEVNVVDRVIVFKFSRVVISKGWMLVYCYCLGGKGKLGIWLFFLISCVLVCLDWKLGNNWFKIGLFKESKNKK